MVLCRLSRAPFLPTFLQVVCQSWAVQETRNKAYDAYQATHRLETSTWYFIHITLALELFLDAHRCHDNVLLQNGCKKNMHHMHEVRCIRQQNSWHSASCSKKVELRWVGLLSAVCHKLFTKNKTFILPHTPKEERKGEPYFSEDQKIENLPLNCS